MELKTGDTDIVIPRCGEFAPGVVVRLTATAAERLQRLAGCSPDYVARLRTPRKVLAVWTSARGDWTSVQTEGDDYFAPDEIEVSP